jgi:hypothetical protein
MTGLTSRLYALPDIQNECYLLTNCPYEVDTFRTQRVLRTYPLQISKPVICAINGSAGGFSAAYPLTCDIRNLMLSIEMALETSERGPVPYLEYTACEWGKKSALDSYYKLFLVTGGQLETF